MRNPQDSEGSSSDDNLFVDEVREAKALVVENRNE